MGDNINVEDMTVLIERGVMAPLNCNEREAPRAEYERALR